MVAGGGRETVVRERRARWPKTAAISRMLGQEDKLLAAKIIGEMRAARGESPANGDAAALARDAQLAADVAIVERLGGLTPAARVARR